MSKTICVVISLMFTTILISACGTEGTTLPNPSMTVQSGGTKQLFLAWDSCFGTSNYDVKISYDGNNFTPVPGCQGLSQLFATVNFTVHTTDWQNGQLMVEARNSSGSLRIPYAPLQLNQSMSAMATGYLKASNAGGVDLFGQTITISADGNTLAIGAIGEDSNATGVNGDQDNNDANDAGAVYIFVRNGNTWSQQAYLKASNTDAGDNFGSDLALSADGNTLAVSAFSEASNAPGNPDDDSAAAAGAVYVFTRTGTTWNQQAYVKAPYPDTADNFGVTISLSADGNTMAVGAPGDDSNAIGVGGDPNNNLSGSSGAVYIFEKVGATWSLQEFIKASNAESGDFFGQSVALDRDGNTLAVGARSERSNARGVNGDETNNSLANAGAAYVFTRTGTIWTQQAYVKASNTEADDYFGVYSAISADGNTLTVSATLEDSNARGIDGNQADNGSSGAGAVYVYTRSGTNWSQQAYVKSSNLDGNDRLGMALALSADGNIMAVGTRGESSNASGVNGDQNDNSMAQAGAVYLFIRNGTTWTQKSYIKASNPDTGDRFGEALTMSDDGSVLAVGAYYESSSATGINGSQDNNDGFNSGAAYLY